MYIAFSGVSSSGKNTIMNELVKRRDNFKVLERSSGTTRQPRESDKIFDTYVYMSEEEFKKGIQEGKFFEYELVHGNYYGTILSQLERAKEAKDIFYIRDIDVKGAVNLKKFFGDSQLFTIFLDAPDDVLRKRLKERGDSEEDIEKRLSRSVLERSFKDGYDLIIENIDMEKTIRTIFDFVDSRTQK